MPGTMMPAIVTPLPANGRPSERRQVAQDERREQQVDYDR
jgi:hypothetical protein